MESNSQPSLVDRSASVVATSVWYHEDIVKMIRTTSSQNTDPHVWEKTESKVIEAIHYLPLTAITTQKVEHFSAFVGKAIKQWVSDHYFLTIDGPVLSNLLCWNPRGVLDRLATAKKVMSIEKNIKNRFRIACMYCLENDIVQLWDLVEQDHLSNAYDDGDCFEVTFWICYLRHNIDVLMDEVQYIGFRNTLWFGFSVSVTNNNVFWTEHFLKKMGEDQKCIASYSKLKDILELTLTFNYEMIPMLSHHLSSEMFDEFILEYPCPILLRFLQYPTTDDFLKIADKTWDVISDEDFYKIIEKMGHYLQEYAGNQIYRNILQQFWSKSLDHCKSYVIQKCINGSFLNRLGLMKHSSLIIKLIFQSSTADQRKEMIVSYNGVLFFDSLIRKGRWGCFSMSIQELVNSKDRENWIDKLIYAYQHIYKINRFPTLISNDFEKLICALEKQKDKAIYLNK